MGLVLRQALLLATGGLLAGVSIALLFRHVLASAIFAIPLLDLPAYAGASALLLGVALAAAAFPARRAAAIDPMRALRMD